MDLEIEHIASLNGAVIRLMNYSKASPIEDPSLVLTKDELVKYHTFHSAKRKSEFYFARMLWKTFGIEQVIQYDAFGRPFLKNGFISVSHSKNLILIGFHPNHAIGVDVEHYSPKIRKVLPKFLSEKDTELIDISNETHITLCWSIKEAVYKMEKTEGLSFKDHIHVQIKDKLAYVDVLKNGIHHLYTFQSLNREKYVLTFCTHADQCN